jgi:hypothetical protein
MSSGRDVSSGPDVSSGLCLESRADTPSGRFEEIATIETKALASSEQVRYTAEFTPGEAGPYAIYAYLYQDSRRLGRKVEQVYVTD